jgi:uncharacterized protein YbjT (DUF2867 family)
VAGTKLPDCTQCVDAGAGALAHSPIACGCRVCGHRPAATHCAGVRGRAAAIPENARSRYGAQMDTDTHGTTTLVFGASGYIGSQLVPLLLREAARVRACARSRTVLEARGWDGAELVQADALQPHTLPAVLEGVETAYYLVHSMAAGRDFAQLDLQAARNFAEAAAAAGVGCIVYLGGLVPADARSEHILSRRDTGALLRAGTVPVIELRAGIIIGPGSAAFEVMRDLVLNLPLMITPRWVRALSPPIALENLLHYLLRLPALPEARGRIFDAAGPEHTSYADMMRRMARAAGRRAPLIVPVPVLSPELSARWLWLVTAVPTPIARALIGGLRHDFIADDTELRRLVPQRLLDVDEAIDAVFGAEREHAVQARWTEGAFPMRGRRTEHAYYAKRAGGTARTTATPDAVWRVVSAIGGSNRYYCANWLWWLRETLDWMLGGPGRNRGRRDPQQLRPGDRVDSWHVLGVEPARRLTLAFGMKAPGAGVLEFEIEPLEDGGTQLSATAYWHPAGVWGLAYWYALVPAHLFIFRGMTRAICRRAENGDGQEKGTDLFFGKGNRREKGTDRKRGQIYLKRGQIYFSGYGKIDLSPF